MITGGLLGQACGPDTSTDDTMGSGGFFATGGTGGAGAATSTGGSGAAGGDTTMCGNGDINDAHVPVMLSPNCETSNLPNCNITDFTAATYDPSSGNWGDDMSLTGETFTYTGDATTLEHNVSGDVLNITASVGGDDYFGVGLSFGPCTDATAFEGIEVTLSGDPSEGGVFDLQVQSDENYPINDADGIGSCAFTVEDEKWNECTNNYFRFEGIGADPITYVIPFTEFTGGTPNPVLNAQMLRGMQFQGGCDVDKAPCAMTIQVHDVRFYRGKAAYLGPEPDPGTGGAGGGGGAGGTAGAGGAAAGGTAGAGGAAAGGTAGAGGAAAGGAGGDTGGAGGESGGTAGAETGGGGGTGGA